MQSRHSQAQAHLMPTPRTFVECYILRLFPLSARPAVVLQHVLTFVTVFIYRCCVGGEHVKCLNTQNTCIEWARERQNLMFMEIFRPE